MRLPLIPYNIVELLLEQPVTDFPASPKGVLDVPGEEWGPAVSLATPLLRFARKPRSSPRAVVIALEADDKTAWVRTGQVYERLTLKLTSLNIKSAFLNQPLEVAELRSQFQNEMGLGASSPQLLVRFGYAEPMPRSLRRPVEQVIISSERNQA